VSTEPSRPARWWIAPVLGAVVVVTAAAALVAHNTYQRPASAAVASTAPVVVAPESTSVPSTEEPGSPVVSITPDVAHFPLRTQVRQLLQTYFDAINSHSYRQWRSVVTPSLASTQTERQYEQGYRTTHDGTIVVYRVDTTLNSGLRVLLTFHSTQAAEDAPKTFPHDCIVWHLVWPLAWNPAANAWKIDAGTTDQSTKMRAC
jgi:hypothetical protein